MVKRAATPSSPMKKKLKKSHPVTVNLETVEEAIHDHHIEIPGSKVCKKMLITALPKALGPGAAVDERHACQKVIVDAVGAVFSAEVTKATEKEAAAQAELETATKEKASADAVLAEKQKAVDDKKADIEKKKETLHANKTALKDAEHELAAATKAVEHHDADVKKMEEKKVKFEHALSVTFVTLRDDPTGEKKKGTETLRHLLGDAGADDSLTTCFHAALQKKPEDRGGFDTTVIGEVEKRMTTYIAKLTSELAEGPASKDKKVAAVEAAKAKKESCTAALEASTEALSTAEKEKPDLEAALKAATHDDKEKGKHVKTVTSHSLEPAQAGLASANKAYEAWKYLAERTAEDEVEKPPEEPAEVAEETKDVSMEAENA